MSPLTLGDFLSRFQLQLPPDAPLHATGRQAAVLVPVVARPQPTLLLTRRAAALRNHAGQVAFPGGMRDDSDASPVATALRETHEEVGIDPGNVQIIGQLPAVTSRTGFQVIPVVGIVTAFNTLRLNKDEVESAFEMPLAEALRLSRYSTLPAPAPAVWFSVYQRYLVWGMTAGILHSLSRQIAV